MHSKEYSYAVINTYREFKKYPFLITGVALFVIYFVQYIFQLLFSKGGYSLFGDYTADDWLRAYIFVFSSALILLMFMFLGVEGKVQSNTKLNLINNIKKPSFTTVLLLFVFFIGWSYLMLKLKIGMTIYADFDPLPYRITGILFYGRLFIQPAIVTFIAIRYRGSRLNLVLLFLITGLEIWVGLTSGSRFATILFAVPAYYLLQGKSKYIFLFLLVFSGIIVATLSRYFFLPLRINDEYVQIYANSLVQSQTLKQIYLMPIYYFFNRIMGIREVLLTFSYGEITSSDSEAMQAFLAYFLPLTSYTRAVSIKNIYGFSDDLFGGLGLDLFSNYWVFFGGQPLFYGLGIALLGWLLGKNYKMFLLFTIKYDLNEIAIFVFVLMFLLLFDGRGKILLYFLPVTALLSANWFNLLFISALRPIIRKRISF